MTIDERIERLIERHEALAATVELVEHQIAASSAATTRQIAALTESTNQRFGLVADAIESTNQMVGTLAGAVQVMNQQSSALSGAVQALPGTIQFVDQQIERLTDLVGDVTRSTVNLLEIARAHDSRIERLENH